MMNDSYFYESFWGENHLLNALIILSNFFLNMNVTIKYSHMYLFSFHLPSPK